MIGIVRMSKEGSLTRVGRIIWPVGLVLSVPYHFMIGLGYWVAEMARGD